MSGRDPYANFPYANFAYWTGDVTGPTNSAVQTITMDQARLLVAHFALDQHTLTIVSDHGTGTPPFGTCTNLYGTVLTNSVTGFEVQGGTQYVCTGWSLTGCVDTNGQRAGVATNVTLRLTNNATLTWVWGTNCYSLVATAGIGGTMTGSTNGWYLDGAAITVTSVPNPGYHVVAWAGNTNGCTLSSNVLVGSMTQARTLQATFAPNPESFRIASAHGTGTPPFGTYTNLYGTVLTNSVSAMDTQGTTQYVSAGWAMAGNDPASGGTNSFIMMQTNSATLTWLWQTNYLLSGSSGGNGTVSGSTNGFYGSGTAVSVAASPLLGYHFAGWTGDATGDSKWKAASPCSMCGCCSTGMFNPQA